MSGHVVCVVTDGTHVLVCKYSSMYILPDSAVHGKLEWKRTDSKRLARKLIVFLTFGIVVPDTMETFKVFGMRQHHRAVKVIVPNLVDLMDTWSRVAAHFKVESPMKMVRFDCDRLSVETRHCLDSMLGTEATACTPQASTAQTTDDTTTESDDDSAGPSDHRAASPGMAT